MLMPPPLHPITTLANACIAPPEAQPTVSQTPLTAAQKAYYRSSLASADLAITKRISAFAQSSGINANTPLPPPPSSMTQPSVAGAAVTSVNEAGKQNYRA